MDLHSLWQRLSSTFSTGATEPPGEGPNPAIYLGAAAAAFGVAGAVLFWTTRQKPMSAADRQLMAGLDMLEWRDQQMAARRAGRG
jgi:hypothetical protein